ncbi:MAG: hypothetical protein DDT32_01099 [Syntrophomonadaceae bacterium]|nr:hypothetical protein [Bacillota bacterium]MBT9147345.1 hypothetical protein [Bacillota bacterium]
MNIWSISFAYRLGLGFHALSNEGAEGSNLMQPRRIDVGKVTYDGISGEIIRRHILEHFVNICRDEVIPMLPLSEGLHPDRGLLGIRQKAKGLGVNKLTKANPQDLYKAVREVIKDCAVLDVGGYLAPFSAEEEVTVSESRPDKNAGIAEVAPEAIFIANIAKIGGKSDGGAPYTIKRDSVFDVAWLISEQPQDLTITQHAAYRPSGQHSLFSQTMRSNIYGGIVRADLHRIGTDDYWYLQSPQKRLAIGEREQRKRQITLIRAIADFISSPTGAKVAAWAPHVFLTEGTILLSAGRTAPFVSPIKVCLNDGNHPVQANSDYRQSMMNLANNQKAWAWSFGSAKELLDAIDEIIQTLEGWNGDQGQKGEAQGARS